MFPRLRTKPLLHFLFAAGIGLPWNLIAAPTPLPNLPEIQIFVGADANGAELADGQLTPVDLGSTPLGTRGAWQSFTVKNAGTVDLHLTGLTLPSGYALEATFTPVAIVPNGTFTFALRFLANTAYGVFAGALSMASDDEDEGSFQIPLTARADYTNTSHRLDPSFGVGGKVVTPVEAGHEFAHSVLVQGDSKIILVGEAYDGFYGVFALARYLPNGTLDYSFGNGGKVLTSVGPTNDVAYAAALQLDGKLVVAGTVVNSSEQRVLGLVRYLPNGELDSTFGSSGKVISTVTGDDSGRSIALQSDGKILVAGSAWGGSAHYNFVLARYTADGFLDSSFGTGGSVKTPIGPEDDFAYSVAIQSDGKIVVAGQAYNGTNVDFAMARYTASGSLDTSFGTGGKVLTAATAGDDEGRSVAIQSDGKILIAGSSQIGSFTDHVLIRYTSSGSLDSTFGNAGVVITQVSNRYDYGKSMCLQSDGKILVGGYGSNGTSFDFTLVRYTPNGEPDSAFGSDGKVMTPVGPRHDYGQCIALQPDGKIIVGGYADNGIDNDDNDFALVRYGAPLEALVETGAAASLAAESVTLSGSVNAQGVVTQTWWEYGTSASYGQATAGSVIGFENTVQPVNVTLSALAPGTTYYYRLAAQSGDAISYGTSQSFTTLTLAQAWRKTHFGSTDVTSASTYLADPDGDGLKNQVERAFGLDPKSGSIPVLMPLPERVGNTFVVTCTVPTESRDLSIGADWSASQQPGSWTPIPDGAGSQHLIEGNTHTFTVPAANWSHLFMRVSVTGGD